MQEQLWRVVGTPGRAEFSVSGGIGWCSTCDRSLFVAFLVSGKVGVLLDLGTQEVHVCIETVPWVRSQK